LRRLAMHSEPIIGTWSLVPNMFKYSYSDGEVLYPFGPDAQGLLIYTSDNHMSVQIMRPERPLFASGAISKGTSEELREAFRGYIAYFGIYRLDEEKGIVIHHVSGSFFPNWVGQYLERYYTFSHNQLILNTMPIQTSGRQMVAQLGWERVI
jgi:hypothetical protein